MNLSLAPKNSYKRAVPASSNCRSGVADSPILRRKGIPSSLSSIRPDPILCASSAINNNRFLGNVANSLNTLSLTNDAYVDIITYDALSGSIVSLSFMRSISNCHDGYLEHTFTMLLK